jgi:hypothetical protein
MMKQRCLNEKHDSYHYYGGRGIKVCDRWLVFENFLADMDERPENMTLDRIDSDGDYELSNCRWTTHLVQMRNSSQTKLTFEQAVDIICMKFKKISHQKIADHFNMSRPNISSVGRDTWLDALPAACQRMAATLRIEDGSNAHTA